MSESKPKYRIIFAPGAREDYLFLVKNNPVTARRINKLIESIMLEPFAGIGKPEALKHELSGFWSRRIDIKNRLVYRIKDDELQIASCLFHYKK